MTYRLTWSAALRSPTRNTYTFYSNYTTMTARVATILPLITTRKIIDISIGKVLSLLNDWSLTYLRSGLVHEVKHSEIQRKY